MADRPVFVPCLEGPVYVRKHHVSFQWFPGMSVSQKRKCIASLHAAAEKQIDIADILEISSKSPQDLGVCLSAFNLMIKTMRHGLVFSVESAYQASKVFERGGPFSDLLYKSSREAKRDERLVNHGRLIAYRFFGDDWRPWPPTAFYSWLYMNALHKHSELASEILRYRAFTDIAFNPERSVNCQAYSAALYVSLHQRGMMSSELLNDQAAFLRTISDIDVPSSARHGAKHHALSTEPWSLLL